MSEFNRNTQHGQISQSYLDTAWVPILYPQSANFPAQPYTTALASNLNASTAGPGILYNNSDDANINNTGPGLGFATDSESASGHPSPHHYMAPSQSNIDTPPSRIYGLGPESESFDHGPRYLPDTGAPGPAGGRMSGYHAGGPGPSETSLDSSNKDPGVPHNTDAQIVGIFLDTAIGTIIPMTAVCFNLTRKRIEAY